MNAFPLLKKMMPWAALAGVLCLSTPGVQAQTTPKDDEPVNELVARSVLKANSFASGPTSGTLIGEGPINGQMVPFLKKQPIQGFSAVLKLDKSAGFRGEYLAMSDNGFGALENSADYLLRVYTIKPQFKTKPGESEEILVKGSFDLKDPDRKIPFAIVNEFTGKRRLTGADFDIESIQMAPDGTLWFGDEFGPFLLHTDRNGKVLEAPIPLPDLSGEQEEIRAPQNPFNEEYSALRIMNAMRKHAQLNGNDRAPVFSPWFVMLDDKNPDTFVGTRQSPALESGLEEASSEIFNVRSLQRAGFPVVVYTVNDVENMNLLLDQSVDGIISDRPDLLLEVLKTYDGDQDGKADYMKTDGMIDASLFDAQGHRGARNLRPENTLPSMEAALDYLMTTLETDCGVTKDGIAVLSHDPYIEAAKARKTGDEPYTEEDEVLIKDLKLKELQSMFIADKILPGRPAQTNDRSLSPVSVAFAEKNGMLDPYTIPTLQQLFDFVDFYKNYYQSGEGASHPQAALRWKNAAKVRFNVETKVNPRTDRDAKGNVFAKRTVSYFRFTTAVAGTIKRNQLQQRADVQSFDFQTLLRVQRRYPQIRTVCLFGDFPKVGEAGDGTNLQDMNGANTPWLAGMYWPYRVTKSSVPFMSRSSGGFEGMALDVEGEKLYPLLEKPLMGGEEGILLISEFDLESKAYTGNQYKYELNERGTAIGDFILYDKNKGLVIERDGSQGDLEGFKAVYEITLNEPGTLVDKRLAVDLMKIKDFNKISKGFLADPGDVGIGEDFAFPFVTIEDILFFDKNTIGVLNDNNFPFSIGRHVGSRLPDDNEFIIIKLAEPLGSSDIDLNSSISARTASLEVMSEALIISPNPAKEGKVNIKFALKENEAININIYDAGGKLVTNRTAFGQIDETFDLGKHHRGLFLVEVWVGDKRISKKLMMDR